VELFARLARVPVAAITGSNGKSTVTTLLGMMAEKAGLRVAVGGNLGTPALELLQQTDVQLYVLELSSFQLETTYSLNADVATVLNISPDHMDRYGSLNDYAQAKQRIFRGSGVMVLNADDTSVMAMAEPERRTMRFTLDEPGPDCFGLHQCPDGPWLAFGEESWLSVSELKIPGYHNVANALAALAMGQVLQLPRPAMLAALKEFSGLPHRSELVADINGVRWFNDSKGTNVGATIAAVLGLPGPILLIAGGDGKGQDFTPLRAALKDKVQALIVMGRDGPEIAAVVAGDLPVYRVQSMEQAVAEAARLAKPGDSVLLSPACASFDMFKNYEERGHVFARVVQMVHPC
jgi:UDP-N-acetylmuramoylalanine--D-glutamate ligase